MPRCRQSHRSWSEATFRFIANIIALTVSVDMCPVLATKATKQIPAGGRAVPLMLFCRQDGDLNEDMLERGRGANSKWCRHWVFESSWLRFWQILFLAYLYTDVLLHLTTANPIFSPAGRNWQICSRKSLLKWSPELILSACSLVLLRW